MAALMAGGLSPETVVKLSDGGRQTERSKLLHGETPLSPLSSSSLSAPLFRSAGYQLARPPVAVGDGALTGECDWTAGSLTSAYREC